MLNLPDFRGPVHLDPPELVEDLEFDRPVVSPEGEGWLREAGGGGPDPDGPAGPHATFADWIRIQAALYRIKDTGAGHWLGSKIEELAREAEFLAARSPEQFEDRRSAMEEMRRHEEL